MKTLVDIQKSLEEFTKVFGYTITDARQGSPDWFNIKLGVVSGSRVSDAMAKKGTKTRLNYMAELVAQVCTGVFEEINSKHMEWGKQHEDAARSSYEFSTGHTVVQVPFVFKDDKYREGCSADGLIVGLEKGFETKCPWASENYIKFLVANEIKDEYEKQVQYSMRILGAKMWDFNQYDPRMKVHPLHTATFELDLKMQTQFDEVIPAFLEDTDKMLELVGVKFGEQWKRLAKAA